MKRNILMNVKAISRFGLCLTLAFAASISALAEKQAPPPAGKAKNFEVPKARKITLANGMGVTFVQYGTVPKVSIDLAVRTGNVDETSQQVWLAELVGDLLTQGTRTRSAAQIAQQSADMGGEVRVNTGADRTDITTDVLSESGPSAVRLLADIASNPTFPEAEVTRLKNDRLRQLSIARTQPQQLVLEKFRAVLYPEHPYGRLFPTNEMLQSYTPAQVRAFYDANFGAARSRIYVVGRFDEPAMEKAIREVFAGWKKGSAASIRVPKPSGGRRLEVIDRPGAVQSTIYLGLPIIDPSNPDYIPLAVTDAILGGSFGSRITSNIREQKGYTYSPGSQMSSRYRDAYWVETADVTTKDTGASLKEIFAEIDRLGKEAPTAQELRGIQNYLAGLFILRNSARQGIIGQLAFMDLHGLPEDYLNTYVAKINAVTPADVQRIAAKYIQGGNATIVVAGDTKVIEDQLVPYKPSASTSSSK
jgi:predicted Zn-dependent peptidase